MIKEKARSTFNGIPFLIVFVLLEVAIVLGIITALGARHPVVNTGLLY